MGRQKNHKVAKFPNWFQRMFLDSGIVLFTIIAIYLVICLIVYFTKPHISIYEVKQGSISRDYSYTGVVLRNEKIINAERSGYLTYYAQEGQKVGAKTTVCAIDETGKLEQLMEQADAENTVLTNEDILSFKDEVRSYQKQYNGQQFDDIYSFKQNLKSSMLEKLHTKILNTATKNMDSSFMNIYKAKDDGVVSFCIDGYENLNIETIDEKVVKNDSYNMTDLKEQTLINNAEPMYKIITDENWSVVIMLDSEIAKILQELEYVEVTFLMDNKSVMGQVSTWEAGGDTYVQFSFTNSMIRYASQRYLDISFKLDDVDGLKIPKTAIDEEEFYFIPEEYISKGGNTNSNGVYLEKYESDGSVSQKFVVPEVSYKTKEDAKEAGIYVSKQEFEAGNALIKPESTERYTIGKTGMIQGVYNINKGYTVFCPISILCENEEYCIVDAQSSYGISQFDRIVLDTDNLEEED